MLRSAFLLFAALTFSAVPVLAQEQPNEEIPQDKDLVELRNGEKLVGRITAETDKQLTIELGPGQSITLGKSLIATYLRRSEGATKPTGPVWPEGLGPRDDWFRLRDAEGSVVGTLRLVTTAEKSGLFRLEESWMLFETKRGERRIALEKHGSEMKRRVEVEKKRSATRLVRIERVDGKLQPRACYYREQLVDLDRDRTRYERIFDAEISHGRMRFVDQSTQGKQRDSIPFPDGSRLPLLVRELLRGGHAKGAKAYHASVFDPMEERFELRKFRLDESVPVPASFTRSKTPRPGLARFLEWQTDGRTHREWISREGQILRIECNGVHLVAEPVSADYAKSLTRPGAEPKHSSVREFGSLELWLPRATWSFGVAAPGGEQQELVAPSPGAKVQVWKQERDPEVLLLGVAQDILRRCRLEEPSFVPEGQEFLEIDGNRVVEIRGKQRDEKGRDVVVRIYVIVTKHVAYGLRGACPARGAGRFLPEFEDFAKGVRFVQSQAKR